MDQVQYLPGVGIFGFHQRGALAGRKQLVINFAVNGIGVTGIHKRMHDMLLVYIGAAGRTTNDELRCDGIIPHHFAYHLHSRLFTAVADAAAQPFQTVGCVALIAQQMRFFSARRVESREFYAMDHLQLLALADNDRARCRSGRVMICHGNSR